MQDPPDPPTPETSGHQQQHRQTNCAGEALYSEGKSASTTTGTADDPQEPTTPGKWRIGEHGWAREDGKW